MTSAAANQFGDTTYTKVFVGGLAWETHKETMKKYFDQFGDILEAVVITDKATGRSKGYGFVTFREPEAAMKSCVDAAPVIDGRRANCNLASLGVQRSKPSTPNKHNNQGGVGEKKCYKIMSSTFQTGVEGAAFASQTSFPAAHYAFHHQAAFPYNVYGYPQYSTDYSYPTTNYYNIYGGGATTGQQYQAYYGAAAAATTGLGGMMNGAAAAFYPTNYLNHQYDALPSSGAAGYGAYAAGFQFPNHHHTYPYSAGAAAMMNSTGSGTYPHHHYVAPMSFAASPVCFAVQQA